MCLAIMFNPTGKQRLPGEHGSTIRKCLRFSEEHGCGELWTCNLFSRKDYPDGKNREPLPDPPDPVEIRTENDRHIAMTIAKADIILCAWGRKKGFSPRTTDERAREVLALLANDNANWKLYALGINNTGRPTHPVGGAPPPDPMQAFRVSIVDGKLVRVSQ